MKKPICGLCLVLFCTGPIIADDYTAAYIREHRKGYRPRPCGFDMDRNGVLGELADRTVADGKTRDPDGDGVDEDLFYVDSETGNDETGDGSPGKPLRTIQKALQMADGPGDGAEDIVCISGTFHESLTLPHGGVHGHYVRDGFQFPRNPTMIVGWDKDGDGQYPPYDADDTAVLDGRNMLAWAVTGDRKLSDVEIAHLTVSNYGYQDDDCGAFKLFRWGTGSQSHVYIHDVELYSINKGEKDASGKIVLSFWGGPMTDVAFINNLVDDFSSYLCRGAPPDRAGRFRFQNNTLKMHGTAGVSFVTGWKLWGHHRGVEILDNVLDGNAHAWKPKGHTSGIGVCQGTQDWTIQGNVLIDLPVILQPFAKGYPFKRTLNNIVIDCNVFRSTYDGWTYPRPAIHVLGARDAPAHQAVENVAITNNFFSTSTAWGGAIFCSASNGGGPQAGGVTIAGNTISGPFAKGHAGITVTTARQGEYRKNNFVIKNNVVANAGAGLNVAIDYAPTNLVADGNVYDPNTGFLWDNTRFWESLSFDQWQAATGQDAGSATGVPEFVDLKAGDLHLDEQDALPRGVGVDVTNITKTDLDGQPRSPAHPTPGADVPLN